MWGKRKRGETGGENGRGHEKRKRWNYDSNEGRPGDPWRKIEEGAPVKRETQKKKQGTGRLSLLSKTRLQNRGGGGPNKRREKKLTEKKLSFTSKKSECPQDTPTDRAGRESCDQRERSKYPKGGGGQDGGKVRTAEGKKGPLRSAFQGEGKVIEHHGGKDGRGGGKIVQQDLRKKKA